jgi:hypothetical protein
MSDDEDELDHTPRCANCIRALQPGTLRDEIPLHLNGFVFCNPADVTDARTAAYTDPPEP